MDIDIINELYYQKRKVLTEEMDAEEALKQYMKLEGLDDEGSDRQSKLNRWEDAIKTARGEMPRADMFDTPEKTIKHLSYYFQIVGMYLKHQVMDELNNNEPEVAKKIVQGLLETIIDPIVEIVKK